MSIDLGDLIESLQREVSPPGTDLFPNATDDNYFGYLQDSFWEIKLDGIEPFEGYTEADGLVSPTSGTTELTRDLQQLVVLYSGIRIIRNELRNINTLFRSVAGPVEFETQQSATVLKAIMEELQQRRNFILNRLSDIGAVDTTYIDMVTTRDLSQATQGGTWWVGHSEG
jgi:hypothetical protein